MSIHIHIPMTFSMGKSRLIISKVENYKNSPPRSQLKQLLFL